MSSVFRSKKTIFILGGVILLTIILFITYSFTPKFNVKEFKKKIEINYAENFDDDPGKVCYGNSFNCKQVEFYKKGDVDTNTLGDYEVTYTYKYNNKKKTLKQVVSVVDKEKPEITVETDNLEVCPGGKLSNIKITATDNVDGDITNKINTETKNNILIITVEDSSGNVAQEEIKLNPEDKEAPVININGNSEIYLKVGDEYKEQGASATDNCDNSIEVKIESNVNTNTAGTYKVKYTATDSSNNSSTKERTIIVLNKSTKNNEVNGSKIIYLTFDDGPSQYTAQLLDVLKKYDVKATFFVTGAGSDSLILREYNEGHTVGLHSNTHDYSYVYSSVDNYYKDLYAIRDRVKKITGQEATLIRFPGGSSNTVSKKYDGGIHIMSILTADVESKGFHYFDWNVSSGDAGGTISTDKVYNNVIKGLRKDESVVLQHDTKKFSIDAVEKIIQYGLKNGYTFKPLTEDSFGAHHGVNN